MRTGGVLGSAVCALLFLACQPESPLPIPAGRRVVDDVGRQVQIPARVRRVVTLAPNITEIVFTSGAGEKIVGTDDFSNQPPLAAGLPKVGGMQPNIEKIVTLRPDLVFATTAGNHPNLAPALAQAKVPLFVLRTDRLEQIPPAIEKAGSLLDAPQAVTAAAQLRREMAAQRRQRARAPKVLFMVWAEPVYVAGRNTFADDLIALTGGKNLVRSEGWPQYSQESLLADPPDLILHPAREVTREQVERLFTAAPSVRKRIDIVAVDEDLFTRPGPRLARAAGELNAIMDRWEKSR